MAELLHVVTGGLLTYFIYSQLREMNLTWTQIAYIEFMYVLAFMFREMLK